MCFITAVAVAVAESACVINSTVNYVLLEIQGILINERVNGILNNIIIDEFVSGDINLAVAVFDIFGLRAEPFPDARVFEIVCVKFSAHTHIVTEDDIYSLERGGGGSRC